MLLLPWLGNPAAFAESAISFSNDLEGSLAQAETTGKPLVLLFSAVWCPHCRAMKRGTLTAPEVQALATEFL